MPYLLKSVLLLATLLASFAAHATQPNIEFVHISAGNFIMGTQDLDDALIEIPPDNQMLITDEQPPHRVALSHFEIGKYEITQGQWLQLMGTKPGPDKYWQHPQWQQLPVVSVSWAMTQNFIHKLNSQSTCFQYRLPTEAEFEYILRDNSTDLRPFAADNMDLYAWTITNSGDVTHPVGTRRPNSFGMYDTYGNAWEWVNDWYHAEAYTAHKDINPQGPLKPTGKKVRRGGSYHCATHIVRAGYRAADPPSQRYSVLGFRLVRENLPRHCPPI